MIYCKLCLKFKELQDSHIIPDAFWRKSKQKGRYISISKDRNQFGQDSCVEKLLCFECEQNLSKIEGYAIKLCLQNPSNIGVSINLFEKYKLFLGVDYAKLKLFQLSILWRASISSAYSNIKLPEVEEEYIRKYIYENSPLLESDYGCLMSILWMNSDYKSTRETKAFMLEPYMQEIGGNRFFVFVFGGFEWRFSCPTCSKYIVDERRVITKQGTMVCALKNVHDDPMMFSAAFYGYKNQKEGIGVNL